MKMFKPYLMGFILGFALAVPTLVHMPYPKHKPLAYNPYLLEKEKQCIVEVLWYEARGEPIEGIKDVLSVVYNRTKHKNFPNTFCKVVHANKQFSYRNAYSKGTKVPVQVSTTEQAIKKKIDLLANEVVLLQFKPTLPPNVLYYHTTKIKPYWAKHKPLYQIRSNHVFRSETS